jgi:hypothetical protein
MSTRAIYTFSDEDTAPIHVYKHHDGYPYASYNRGEAGGLLWIKKAKELAWELPRFEADEFAASFVAANKTESGGCRLITTEHPWEYASDAEYWYKIKLAVPALDVWVDVYEVDWSQNPTSTLIMEGSLSELIYSEQSPRHSRFEASPYYGEKDELGNEPILGWGVLQPDGEWIIEDGLTEAEAEAKADELNRSCGLAEAS